MTNQNWRPWCTPWINLWGFRISRASKWISWWIFQPTRNQFLFFKTWITFLNPCRLGWFRTKICKKNANKEGQEWNSLYEHQGSISKIWPIKNSISIRFGNANKCSIHIPNRNSSSTKYIGLGFLNRWIAIYVRKDLAVKTAVNDSNSFCDYLILHIPQLNLVLMNVYRPPNCPDVMFNQTIEYLRNFLRNLEEYINCANTYMLVGDFNLPFMKVGKETTTLNENIQNGYSSDRKQARTLLNFADEFFLEQYIKKQNRKRNILDLVFHE